MKFSEIIANKQQFPDDAKFTLAGEEVTFGELRRQNTESHGQLEQQLNTRQAELEKQARTQQDATNTLARVLDNVSQATGLSYEELVAGKIPAHLRQTVQDATARTRTESGLALKDDPLYKPIFDAAIEPLNRDMSLVKSTLGTALGAYQNDHARLAYLDYMQSEDRPANFKPKFPDALQLAVNKGYKDELGFPDVSRALRELAGPVAQKTDNDKIREEGRAEGRKEAEQQFLRNLGEPQPGTGGISFDAAPDAKTAGKPKTIKEKLNEAFSDPTIAAGMFGTGTVQ